MEAVISGQAGVAFLILGDERFASIHATEPDLLVPRTESEFRLLFGEASDLDYLESVDRDAVARSLDLAHNQADGLHLSLILLDPTLSPGTRKDAAVDLEELLGNEAVVEYVERVFFSRPLPPSADVRGALDVIDANSFAKSLLFLERLVDLQHPIQSVHDSWRHVESKYFDDTSANREFLAVLVKEGIVRELVLALARGKPIGSVKLLGLQNPRIARLPNHRRILNDWYAPFSQPNQRAQPMPAVEIEAASSEYEEDRLGASERRKGRRFRGIDRKGVSKKVDVKKQWIFEALRENRLVDARKLIDELVESQRKTGETIYICKSLCDIAREAKNLGLYLFQLELTRWSLSEKPDDARSWNQNGDALLNNGRFQEALDAFDQSLIYNADVVARNGRAEVLRALGRGEEALHAYDQAIRDFPNDVVARAGRAEVLRALGRDEEALDAYDQAIRDFPNNVVARAGRAEVLRALGRDEEALHAYDQAIRDFPNNVVARAGRAEVLRALGRDEEALHAYDQAIRDFPNDVVARNGRAWVLSALGRWDEALKSLPDGPLAATQGWITFHMRGMILLRRGDIDSAIEIFNRGVSKAIDPKNLDYFRSALAIARLKNKQFSIAREVIASILRPTLVMELNLLNLHAFGALNDQGAARKAYENLMANRSGLIREVAEELKDRYILQRAPKKDDDWIIQRELEVLRSAY